MSDTLGVLDLEYIDGHVWRLLNAFPYLGKFCGRIVVPEGFLTDFASIPRIMWSLLPPTGQYGKAAVVHDYLYRTGSVTRENADKTFLEAMTRLGVGRVTRQTMYWAVRLGGAGAYHRPSPELSPRSHTT